MNILGPCASVVWRIHLGRQDRLQNKAIQVFNRYILLRSLLRASWSIIATKTPRYLHPATAHLRATQPFHISKDMSRHLLNFLKVGTPVDPEQPFVHYSQLASYCHICLSLRRAEKPCLSDSYTNIYPLRIGLRRIYMCSHIEWLFAGQKMASLCIVDSISTWTTEMHSGLRASGIIWLSL